eukprot:64836_1
MTKTDEKKKTDDKNSNAKNEYEMQLKTEEIRYNNKVTEIQSLYEEEVKLTAQFAVKQKEFVEKRDQELLQRRLELEYEINSFDQEYKEFESDIINITEQRFHADNIARIEHKNDLCNEVYKYKVEMKLIQMIHKQNILRSTKDIDAMSRYMKDLDDAKRRYENELKSIKTMHTDVKIRIGKIARENVDAKIEFDDTEENGKNEYDRTLEMAK